MELFVSNGQEGYITPSQSLRVESTQFMSFDINGDGINELLSTKAHIDDNLCWFIEFETSQNNCTDFKPFYLSDVTSSGYEYNDFNFFDDAMRLYKNYSKGDVNNDGLDDLLISYYDCDELCDIEKTRIFFNSPNGLQSDNTQEYDFIVNGEITGFDGNGVSELASVSINDSNNISTLNIVEINPDGGFSQLEFELGIVNGNFSYVDFNNDGQTDVLYSNNDLHMMIMFGNSNLEDISLPVVLINRPVYEYKITDFNNDDLLDIFIIRDNKFYKYLNNGSGGVSSSSQLHFDVYPPYINADFADFTGNGEDEIFVRSWHQVKVYQLNENSQYEEIHEFTGDRFFEFDYNYDLIIPSFIDIDNDSRSDILIGNKIYFSRPYNFHPGLNYDPNHNGHGFSLENVGNDNQFFTVFYTYDNQGNSEWFSSLGLFEEPTEKYWVIGNQSYHPIKTFYDYHAQSFYQNNDSSYLGTIIHDACTDVFGQFNLSFNIGVSSLGIPLERGDWCSEPIVDYYKRPKTNDMSGLWWAGNEDAGWGWSVELIETGERTDMVVILYYYDGDGQPRWLIGQQSGFQAGQEITLDMSMIQGYGRSASPTDAQLIPAGTMSLTLNQASSNIISAGTLSIDVSYPGDEGGHWVRDSIPIALFSEPR